MLTSANRSRTGPSVLEAAVGQPKVHLQDLRLAGRVFPPEGEEADLIAIQSDFTPDQAVGPELSQRPGLPEQDDLAAGVATPEVDQATLRPFLQIELPVPREGTTARGGLDPRRPLPAHGS